ncbi:MAG: glycosyltransferase [Lachnospiraceae bacterium]|nr:glycosyltransferase [Lachnospiraceae bacterium]
MFHCGGTAITYDVTGHDEYIINGVNGLVVHSDEDEKVVEYINQLKEDATLLARLKQGAIDTAENWIDWQESSKRFYEAVLSLAEPRERDLRAKMEKMSKFYFDNYIVMQDYLNTLEDWKPATNFVNKVSKIVPTPVRKALKKYMLKHSEE